MAGVSFSKMPYEFLCLVSVPPNTSQILLEAFTSYAQEFTKCLKTLSSIELINSGHFRKMAAMQQGLEGPLWERKERLGKPKGYFLEFIVAFHNKISWEILRIV
jgi:hypothetical protein